MKRMIRNKAVLAGFGAIVVAIIALIALFSIPQMFIYTNVITSVMQKVLGWKIDDRYSGGPVLARFRDAIGDDKGEGTLEYPLSEVFSTGKVLDLARYVVHAPQTNSPWTKPHDFWQLDLTMATLQVASTAGGFAGPNIHIYIDIDGKISGSIETREARAEGVSFNPEHPWDFEIEVDGMHRDATLWFADGTVGEPVIILKDTGSGTLKLRIPLGDARLKKLLDGRDTWHYVLIGAWDEYARGHFMLVREIAGLGAGGGARSSASARVYDCLLPRGINQNELLGSANGDSGNIPILEPVFVPGTANSKLTNVPGIDSHRIAELEVQVAAEEAESAKKNRQLAAEIDQNRIAGLGVADTESKLEFAVKLFQAGRDTEARPLLDAILLREPKNPKALAYHGALVAKQGGKSASVAESLNLVNVAYREMDMAAELAGAGDVPDVLICRASVSLSVPEEVFARSKQGAGDLMKVAGLSGIDESLRAWCLCNAGIAYERAGLNAEAETVFQELASLKGSSALARLELARRDMLDE